MFVFTCYTAVLCIYLAVDFMHNTHTLAKFLSVEKRHTDNIFNEQFTERGFRKDEDMVLGIKCILSGFPMWFMQNRGKIQYCKMLIMFSSFETSFWSC